MKVHRPVCGRAPFGSKDSFIINLQTFSEKDTHSNMAVTSTEALSEISKTCISLRNK